MGKSDDCSQDRRIVTGKDEVVWAQVRNLQQISSWHGDLIAICTVDVRNRDTVRPFGYKRWN